MLSFNWEQGEDHGVVWPGGVALIAGEVELSAVVRLWSLLDRESDLTDFLEALSGGLGVSLLSLPDFGVAFVGDSATHLAARGRFVVTAGDVDVIDGAGVTTWLERTTGAVQALSIGSGRLDADATVRPVADGVVPASRLMLQHVSGPDRPGAARERGIEVAPVGAEPVPEPEVTPDPVETILGPVEADGDEDVEQVDDVERAYDVEQGYGVEHSEADSEPMPEAEPAAVQEPPADPEPDPDVSNLTYSSLWGATSLGTVEDAAVRHVDDDEFIVGVPPAMRNSGPASASHEPGAEHGWDDWDSDDHDGHTIIGLAQLAPQHPTAPPVAGLVLAVTCPNGHQNPPQRSRCWRCDAALTATAGRVARPSIGTIRACTGELVELDKDIIVGRQPRAVRGSGTELPRVLALPYAHVSGTHLLLRLEEWNLLAVDQHSTNGTFLRRHNDPPARLPESAVLLRAGDVLDFGHGAYLTVETLA